MIHWHLLTWLFLTLPLPANERGERLDPEQFWQNRRLDKEIKPETYEPALLEAALFHRTNEERTRRNLTPFVFHTDLLKAAQGHSQHQARHDYFGHINRKDRRMRSPMQRVHRLNEHFVAVAENLAQSSLQEVSHGSRLRLNEAGEAVLPDGSPIDYRSYRAIADEVVKRWMDSPPHRENILGDYQFLGCGLSTVQKDRYALSKLWITQNFGSL